MSDPRPATSENPARLTESQWQSRLTPEQYRVLRLKGTERPFTGQYDRTFTPGTYSCAACGQELFSSDTKFDARCGWPAFYAAKAEDRVTLTPDHSHGVTRIEVTCSRCGSHLGHVFPGELHEIAGEEKTVSRFCINSVSLKFTPTTTAPKT
jgi:peptide-methionine (R)-S-oxide reductase